MARPAIQPREILADELEELGMSAAAFSRSLHIPTNRVTQILRRQRAIRRTPRFGSDITWARGPSSG